MMQATGKTIFLLTIILRADHKHADMNIIKRLTLANLPDSTALMHHTYTLEVVIFNFNEYSGSHIDAQCFLESVKKSFSCNCVSGKMHTG